VELTAAARHIASHHGSPQHGTTQRNTERNLKLFTSNPENQAAVERLVNALIEMPIGSVLAYPTLNSIAGCDVTTGNRYLLLRARDKAEKDVGCIFEPVRSIGLKRLTASESPEVGLSTIRGVRRKARKGARRLQRIDSNSLSDTERKRQLAYGSLLGAVAVMADGNKARTIAAIIIDPVTPIPPSSILQMFVED
jgi:hypothetical protein